MTKNLKRYFNISYKILISKLFSKLTKIFLIPIYRIRMNKFATYSFNRIDTIKCSKLLINNEIYQHINTGLLSDYLSNVIKHKFNFLGTGIINFNLESYSKTVNKVISGHTYPNRLISMEIINYIDDDFQNIYWNFDVIKQFEFENKWQNDITIPGNIGVDVKRVWELGRMQHLPFLAIKNKNNYNNEILNQILDFIIQNPPSFGIQWKSPMDVSIRMINWIMCISILNQNKIELESKVIDIINVAIFDHYTFVKSNIEYSEGMRGNHYFTNICSLLIASIYLGEDFKNDTKYFLKSIGQELEYQFNEDGSNFEASTSYHLLCAEIFFTTLYILKLNTSLYNLFYNQHKKTISHIFTFTSELIQFKSINIGDNDSGFYCFNNLFFNNREKYLENLFKLLEIEINNTINNRDNFEDFGLAILKNNYFSIIYSQTGIGQNGKGGHSHCDDTSIILYIKKSQCIVDPGTFTYTSDYKKRNLFRSSEYHNVISLNKFNQYEFSENSIEDMFWLNSQNIEIINFNKDKETISVKYKLSLFNLVRIIKLDKIGVHVTEKIEENQEFTLNIHFHPGVEINLVNDDIILLINNEEFIFKSNSIIDIDLYDYSPNYGEILISKKLILKSTSKQLNWSIEKK